MNPLDSRAGAPSDVADGDKPQDFHRKKEDVTEALGGARQHADAQSGQYRDIAADKFEALAQDATSCILGIEDKDSLGTSDYLTDMAASMTGLAGNPLGKSAEQLLHETADLACSNPG